MTTPISSMNLEQLRAAVSSGGVASITLQAQGDSFFVKISTRSGQDAMLARVRGPEPRCFVNPRSGLGMLREAGIVNVTVDLSAWEPVAKREPSRSRSAPGSRPPTKYRVSPPQSAES